MTAPVDHRQLMAEIDAEVRRRRESGDLPADFERELDLVFARFAPLPAIGDDFQQVLERAEQSTFIDILAPLESSRPLVPHIKRVIRKAISWEMRHVAQQVMTFAQATTRALRLLGQRVDAVEQATLLAVDATDAGAGIAGPDVDHWGPVVIAALQSVEGRVLHTECGNGELVARLMGSGVDAYGVDPLERSAPSGVEIRMDDAVAHLEAVPDEGLGGVVLSNWIDRMPVGALVQMADLACRKVRPGGAVVVMGTDPRAWDRLRDPVEVDLAPGRPLRAETWAHLLAPAGWAPPEVVYGPRSGNVEPVPGLDPKLDSMVEQLNDVLFPPAEYAVVARRRM